MIKKILIIVVLLLCTGCTIYNIDTMSYDEIINTIAINDDVYNTNSKGYRYYLPQGFTVTGTDFNQTLLNNQDKYYLFVDAVSYYNNVKIECESKSTYYYKEFFIDNKSGYVNILNEEEYFYMEIMYNYAIIEVRVKEEDIKTALVSSMQVLSSIKYNHNTIERLIEDNLFESKIVKYEIFGPDEKDTTNYLELYGAESENTEMEE